MVNLFIFSKTSAMSHGKERKEKNCLNCNARVFGRYCQVCGQENIEPRETAWGLIVHFFNDITHFEGKFSKAIRYLLFRPGFLPAEYARGRRMSYMNPVRMYVFTSAFFFIIFFSVFKIDNEVATVNYQELGRRLRNTDVDFDVNFVSGEIKVDKVVVGNINRFDELNNVLIDSLVEVSKQRADTATVKPEKDEQPFTLVNFGTPYLTVAAYDSIQQNLPASNRDGWFMKQLNRKAADANAKYGKNPGLAFSRLSDVFLHKMPAIFFTSLPLFALILSLLYIRHRKNYNFVNHAIFSIYYYIFCFLLLLIFFASEKLGDLSGWSVFTFINVVLFFWFYIYLYKAMRSFYGQRRAITVLKFFLLNFMFFIVVVFLFVGFLIFSAFNI